MLRTAGTTSALRRTASVHPGEHARGEGALLLRLLRLLRLLLRLLLRRRARQAAVFRQRRLQVLVPRQREHVYAVFLAVC